MRVSHWGSAGVAARGVGCAGEGVNPGLLEGDLGAGHSRKVRGLGNREDKVNPEPGSRGAAWKYAKVR